MNSMVEDLLNETEPRVAQRRAWFVEAIEDINRAQSNLTEDSLAPRAAAKQAQIRTIIASIERIMKEERDNLERLRESIAEQEVANG